MQCEWRTYLLELFMCCAYLIPTFLSGRMLLSRGRATDYTVMARFHYRPRPATIANLWTIRYRSQSTCHCGTPQLIALATVSYPIPALRAREAALGLDKLSASERLEFINQNVRTISRVIVHPTFRSLGLAGLLVRSILHHA